MSRYLKIKAENDRIFREGNFPEMRSAVCCGLVGERSGRAEVFRISDHLLQTDTISACLQFRGKRVCALNFANANVPGGGYILGGNAQEEALCRASLLYYTIRKAKAFYQRNHLHVLPDYTDTMIYSENVPVIRDNTGAMLETPMLCNFITSPAVNRTFAKFLFTGERLDRIMQERIRQIILLAASKAPDVLILGAFGCGVFGNKRETVYPMFEEAVNRYLPDSITVIFADPRGGAPAGNSTPNVR